MDYLDAQEYDNNDHGHEAKTSSPRPPQYDTSPYAASSSSSKPRAASSSSIQPPSYSASASTAASSFSSPRRQYIWDEAEEERPNNHSIAFDYPINGRSGSRGDYSENRESREENNRDGSSVSDMVAAVRSKVDVMKIELKRRIETVRELQSELARLRKAKERRIEKCEKSWNIRLNDLKDEQNKMLKRQKDFFDKISEDSRVLIEKDKALRDKNMLAQSSGEAALNKLQQDGLRRKDRTKQQWVADERVSFDKVHFVFRFKPQGFCYIIDFAFVVIFAFIFLVTLFFVYFFTFNFLLILFFVDTSR